MLNPVTLNQARFMEQRTPLTRRLGLDVVSTGAHFASLNRFTKLSEQAGLSEAQRQRLLAAVRQEGEVASPLRRELEAALRRRQEQRLAAGLKVDDLVASARRLPETLEGPLAVRLAKAPPDNEAVDRSEVERRAPPPQAVAGPETGPGPSALK
jgi:hypothetical protein